MKLFQNILFERLLGSPTKLGNKREEIDGDLTMKNEE
jgi:hypothetical protein